MVGDIELQLAIRACESIAPVDAQLLLDLEAFSVKIQRKSYAVLNIGRAVGGAFHQNANWSILLTIASLYLRLVHVGSASSDTTHRITRGHWVAGTVVSTL